jgi:glycosyltransferase involved in cell wall biosynthesis
VNYRGGGAERFLARQWRIVVPMLRRATILVVPSTVLSEVFARYGVEARLIANVVDTTRFFPGQYAEISARQEPTLITTRNLEPIYDVATAIRAFAIVRRALGSGLLVVAGDGPERARLEALARDLGVADAVSFKGRLPPDDLAVLLRSANVLLNPSRVDNMPNSLLEALASGLPLVSTNVGGIPKIIEDGETGVLVGAGDADAMAAAALAILRDRDRAMRIAGAARNAARRFTWEVIGGQWRSLYARALQGG